MRYLFIIFILPASLQIGNTQSLNCQKIIEKLQILEDRFSKSKITEVKKTLDSLSSLIPKNCSKGKMIYKVTYARIEKISGKPNIAVQYLDEGYKLAKVNKYYKYQKHILNLKSAIESENENYKEALILLDSAFNIPCYHDSIECFKQKTKIKLNKGIFLRKVGRFQDALDNYIEAESYMTQYGVNDSLFRVAIFNSIGIIYKSAFNDLEESLKYYKKGLFFCPYNDNARFSLFNNIGNRFVELNQLDSARYYYNKTILSTNLTRYLVTPFQGLGDINLKLEQYPEAIKSYETAIENAEKSNKSSLINTSKSLLAKAHYLNGDYSKAKSVFQEVQSYYSEKSIAKSKLLDVSKYVYLNEIAELKPMLSREFLVVLSEYDSLNNKERLSFLNNSVSKYEKLLLRDSLAKEVLIKENQNIVIQQRNFTIGGSLFALILFGLLAWFYRKYYKIEKELKTMLEKEKQEWIFEKQELVSMNKSFKDEVKKLSEDNEKTMENIINIKGINKIHSIELSNITYITAERDGSKIHLAEGNLWCDTPLKDMCSKLPNNTFIQIFRSTIVNFAHIEWVNHSSLQLKDGTELKISRTYRDAILKRFNK